MTAAGWRLVTMVALTIMVLLLLVIVLAVTAS